jgi:hypothetical protein
MRCRSPDSGVRHFGYSADEIVRLFAGLTLGRIHAALAYYFDHRQEIEDELAADESWAKELPAGVTSRLRVKLGA